MSPDGLEIEHHAPDTPLLSEPAPCDSCRHSATCGAQNTSCSAFALYVLGRDWSLAPRVPDHAQWARLFGKAA
jgi:hypothetical protein